MWFSEVEAEVCLGAREYEVVELSKFVCLDNLHKVIVFQPLDKHEIVIFGFKSCEGSVGVKLFASKASDFWELL